MEIFFKKIFSIATYEIDKAIIGSTIVSGTRITSKTPRNIVIVWAIVKTEICINSGLNFGEKRNRPNTNKIWSIPLGKMCWKPMIKYLVISLNKFEYFFSIENDLEIKEFLMYSV